MPPRAARLGAAASGALLLLALAGCSAGSAGAAGGTGGGSDGRTSAPPWPAPSNVSARVKAAGLTMLTAEGTALHTHQHLSVTVDGAPVTVPADIGIDEAAQRISAIHTHDPSGILHVESPEVRTFRLGQAFAEWDVRLGEGEIGPYIDGQDGAVVAVFVNGKRTKGDPRDIELTAHEDIDVVVVHGGAAPHAPAPFSWPAGY